MDDWLGNSCTRLPLHPWTMRTKQAKQQRWRSLARMLSLANQTKGISCSPPVQWSVLNTFPEGMPGTLLLPRQVERRILPRMAGIRIRVPMHAISHGSANKITSAICIFLHRPGSQTAMAQTRQRRARKQTPAEKVCILSALWVWSVIKLAHFVSIN